MEFDPSTNVVWKCAVPAGNSPPCIVGTRIFPTAYEEHVLQTICIEHRDGSVMWRRFVEPIQTERSHRINGLASPAPALLEGRACVRTEESLYAFSLPQQLPGTGDYFSTGRFSSLPHSAQEPS